MERIHYRISTSMKKIVKWVVIILLIPPLLFLILTVLLYLPPIQNWAAGHVADYASRQLDMDISVGHVSLKFPLDLQIDDFQALKANDSINGLTDTIAKVDKLVAKVQFKPLLKKQVEIDALQLSNAIVNTDGLIPDTRVKGRVGNLSLQCHGVDLEKQTLRVDEALLEDADIDVALGDSVPPDTTETENFWKIYADKLRVSNSKVAVHMPGDTLSVAADISLLTASNGAFDLGEGKYTVAQLDLKGNSAKYNKNFEKAVEGLDTNHLHFSGIDIGLDSVSYQQPHLDVKVRHCALQEKSGIQIEDLTGRVALDSTRLAVNNLNLKTPDSHIKADVQMDLDAFDLDPAFKYKQLVLWDPDAECIIGGYRYVLCDEVMYDRYGQPIMPSSHLFRFTKRYLHGAFLKTIELSRSFIRPEYQSAERGRKSLFSLDNLFDGLGGLILLYKGRMEYFFGKMTIYPSFPEKGLQMLLYFLRKHFGRR